MIGWLTSRMLPVVPKAVVRRVASRYVAGEDLDAAVAMVRGLNARGYEATLDILGENARDSGEAERTRTGYREVLDRIQQEGLKSNVSIKLTHLGVRLDATAAKERLETIVQRAKEYRNFVRMDMEDSSLTQVTLDLYEDLHQRYRGAVGAVLQAYLHRTAQDAQRLAALGANVRLCKGIYREPRAIAYQDREQVRKSFLQAAATILNAPDTYLAFATHDRVLIDRCLELVRRVPADRYEFQALLGVPVEDLLDRLVARGVRVRVYVPYGSDWYPYATRRLRENPKIASYVLRQLFSPRRTEAISDAGANR